MLMKTEIKVIQEINIIDLVDKYRQHSVLEYLGPINSLRGFRSKMIELVDNFLLEVEAKSMLNTIKKAYLEFDEYCKDILMMDKLIIEETKEAVKAIFEKIYKIEEYKVIFQAYYKNITTIVSTLKILDNSFKAITSTLPEEIIKLADGTQVKTVSMRKEIIDSLFCDLTSYISIFEDTQKKHVLSLLYRAGGLVEILLKQDQSVRSTFKYIQAENELAHKEGKLEAY